MTRALTFIGGMLSFAVGFMLTDITGLTGIRLPRDAWTCMDRGPSIRHDEMSRHGIPEWRLDQEACKQWSRK